MHRIVLFTLALLLPFSVFAEGDVISRAEGFRLLWEPLNRPAEETWETPFEDVQESHSDFLILTYAKARGVVEDGTHFRPDDPLKLRDALLWLLRSRNTAQWSTLKPSTAPAHARRYGLLQALCGTRDRLTVRSRLKENPELTQQKLQTLIETLDNALAREMHSISYYGNSFAGNRTAFGEVFDPGVMTAAHRTLPHNTLVRLTNTANDHTVVVRINDRGPYIAGRDMDVSRAAFEHLAPISNGVLHGIMFERLGSSDIIEQKQEVASTWYLRHAERRRARRARRQ